MVDVSQQKAHRVKIEFNYLKFVNLSIIFLIHYWFAKKQNITL